MTMAVPLANRSAAPTAWTIRNATSCSPLPANPQRADPTVKTANPNVKSRTRPNWSANRPTERSSTEVTRE